VQVETGRELVDKCYPPPVEDKSGSRGYKEAFLAAVKKMGGVDAGGADRTVSGESRRPSTTTRNASPDASSTRLERESAKDQGCGKSSQDGPVRPCELDVVLFLSEGGDIGPLSLWREKLIASEPSSAPAGVGQAAAADEAVDAGLKSLFVDNGLSAVCAEKRKLVAMVEGQRTVAEGVAESINVATSFGSRAAATAHAADARLPCIEDFFCKFQPDKDKLLRTIESVQKADASDKDEKLKELEALVSDTVEPSNRTKRSRNSKCCPK
jgi:hypothetical protein